MVLPAERKQIHGFNVYPLLLKELFLWQIVHTVKLKDVCPAAAANTAQVEHHASQPVGAVLSLANKPKLPLACYDADMADTIRRNLPNALTILRLLLAGGFFAALNAYRYPDHHVFWAYLAIGLFVFAAVTDFFDGYLARKWEVVSVFGRVMDPFCDKVLIMGAFIYLAGPRFVVPQWVEADDFFTMSTGVYPWMVAVILARELLVTSIRGAVESTGQSFAAKLPGKLKMILQSIVIPVVIFLVVTFKTGDTPWAMWTCHVLIYATVIVTVWSGLPYVLGARNVLRGNGEAL